MVEDVPNAVLAERIQSAREIALDAQRKIEQADRKYVRVDVYVLLKKEVESLGQLVEKNTRLRLLALGALIGLQPIIAYLVQVLFSP